MSGLHEELNQKKYIILNEFSEKNIDDLYSYCGGSFKFRLESINGINGNNSQHSRNRIK